MICQIMIPHRNDITPETQESLKHWPKEWQGIKFQAKELPNSGIINARNNLLWGGEGNDPFDDSRDLLLFWDSDIKADIKDFEMMLKLNRPAVFGLYPFNKNEELEKFFVGGCFLKGFPGCHDMSCYLPTDKKQVFEGSNLWGGLGFTLIRKSLLMSLIYPWIDVFTVKAPKEYPREREIVSDDIGFCMKLHKAGIKVVLDGRLSIEHVKRKVQSEPENWHRGDPQSAALKAISLISELSQGIAARDQQIAKAAKIINQLKVQAPPE